MNETTLHTVRTADIDGMHSQHLSTPALHMHTSSGYVGMLAPLSSLSQSGSQLVYDTFSRSLSAILL